MEIKKDICDILLKGTLSDTTYKLPAEQLDRKTYTLCNQVIENAGGKWSRKDKCHVFANGTNKLKIALENKETINEKKLFQFFETPLNIVEQMIKLANIKEGEKILEPSAGHGAIVKLLPNNINLTCIEIDKEKCEFLEKQNFNTNILNLDFLEYKNEEKELFDKIIMNPPFTKGQDAKHVLHAYNLLKTGGIIVSVMSAGVLFKQDKNYKKVREIALDIIECEDGAFKDSGTNVKTVIVVIEKYIEFEPKK